MFCSHVGAEVIIVCSHVGTTLKICSQVGAEVIIAGSHWEASEMWFGGSVLSPDL